VAKIRNYFITGLIAVIPIAATIGIFVLILKAINSLLSMPVSSALKIKKGVIAGFIDFASGITITILVIILAGYITTKLGKRGVFKWFESSMKKLPLINSLYTSIKELVNIIAFNKAIEGFTRTVLVEYPRKGIYALGFVTAKSMDEIDEMTKNRLLNIYVPKPMSLASGYLIFVPEDDVISLDIPIEEGFKMVVSGGLIIPK